MPLLIQLIQFNIRLCPALQDKAKAKQEVLAQAPEAKRQKTETKEPFKPPYVPELFVGAVKGLDGEDDMSVLVRPS